MADKFDEYFVQEKSGVDRLLDFLVFIAVLVVTVFLLLEIFSDNIGLDMDKLATTYLWVNIGVFLVFFADLVRLWYESEGFKDFCKKNWLDILATIPFGLIAEAAPPVFGVLKLARLSKITAVSKVQKVSRISKISKEFKAAAHMKKEGEEYKKKHRI